MKYSAIPTWTATPQPGYQINSAAIDAAGETCLLGTSEEYATGKCGVYCYDAHGRLRWSDALGQDTYQGVFWVALSADGKFAAAGGTLADTSGDADGTSSTGFLRAYDTGTGARWLDLCTTSRVNQVALSARGETLIAVAGDELQVFSRSVAGYQRVASHTFDDQYCQSCATSADGTRIVVGTTRSYDVSTGAAGTVTTFTFDGGALQLQDQYGADVAIMRVDMLPDGSWWVASRHDGRVMAFTEQTTAPSGTPAWIYGPADLPLSVAYAVAVARTTSGELRVVCGANLSGLSHGCLYAATSVPATPPATGHVARPLWQLMLQFDPNPGVSMNVGADLVTATDGQPESGGQESAGTFYLFSGDGELQWACPTPLMNWPLADSATGTAAFGTRDAGTA